MGIKLQKSNFVPIPAGTYPGMIVSVDKDGMGKFGKPNLKWNLKVKVDGKVAEVSALTSECSNPLSNLYKWSVAAGIDLSQEEIELGDLAGKKVYVVIEDNKKESGMVFPRVKTLLPAGIKQ